MKEFYKYTEQIDGLIKIEKPTEKDLKKLLGIIGDDKDLAIYFYDKNNNGEWATLLDKAGEFAELAGEENVNELLPRMKAHYLVEAANQKPKEVVALISKIDVKDIIIQGIFLKALLKKPLGVVEEGVNIIKKYFEERDRYTDWYMVGELSAEFMTAIAEKYPDKAFEIAEALLEMWKPEKQESFLDDTRTKFKEHDYEDLVFKHYKNLWELHSLRSAKLLIDIFNHYLEELPEDDYSLVRGFNVRIERLDKIRERFHREVVKVIVQGICEAGKAAIEKQPEKIDELLDYLESLKKVIFERIELYLLRFVPAGTKKGRISSMISNKRFLDNSYWWYEYRLLLRDKFEDTSDEAKKVFIDWVNGLQIDEEEKESINSWYEEYKDRAEKPDFEKIINHRKARQLFLVRTQFPKLYEKYQFKSGSSDEDIAPIPRIGEVVPVSGMESSPLSVEEMLQMEPSTVIEYILEPSKWKIDKKQDYPWHTPEEGLATTFGKVVQQRVEEYIDLGINELMKLKPEFLRNYAIGIRDASNEKNIKDTNMPKVLNQLHYVVKEKKDDLGYQGYIGNMLFVIRQLFDDSSLKDKIVKTNLNVIWEIIEPLVSYNDRREITEETYKNPHSACINCVPGRSFEFVIRFGLVCKNTDEEEYIKSWSSKIQAILTNVINEVKDPRIRSALGVWFPQLHWLEKDLTSTNIDRIFDQNDDKEWNVVWGSYIKWARAYRDVFRFLADSGKYAVAIEKIRSDATGDEYNEPEKGLIQHLMIAYFNGWIEWENPLLTLFFERAPVELRGQAIDFLKTGFKSVNENEDEDYRNRVRARIALYWRNRLNVVRENPKQNFEEAVRFCRWVKDSPLEPEDTLSLLHETLVLTGGNLGRNVYIRGFLEGIRKIAEGHELEAIKCLKMSTQDDKAWFYTSEGNRDNIKELLDDVLKLADNYPEVIEIRKEAKELADNFGRLRIYDFRDHYNQLIKIS